ncbi:SPOR domain-containing protein [Butyricimonas sp.]|uniref:SPOR domain-containing protein n=1 Tax=Butyricimonas sp. TaxID=1969738 RepID=UPI0025BA2AFE|nr:SPOR domain-containing protein [Butyricimonas sp.]
MKFVLFLSFIALLTLVGCQRDKMNPKNLTTVNVKRELSVTPAKATAAAKSTEETPVPPTEAQPSATPQTTTTEKPATPTKSYHIIVASHPRESLAQEDVARLKAQGYTDARIITKDQRYRVSIANNPDKQEATRQRDELARRLKQDDIWITLY